MSETLASKTTVTIYEYIAIERKRQGLSIGTLAKRAGLHRNYISSLERGKAENPSLGVLIKVFDALGYVLNIKFEAKEGENGR